MLTKVHIIKAMIFPVVLYRCKSWTVKKVKCQRIDAFKLWCWRRLLRVLWTAKISNQSILKEVNPEYSLEGLILKLKLWHLATWCEELIHWKRHWCWKKMKAGAEGDERMRWLDAMSLSELWEMVKDREAWHAAVHGVTKSWTRLSNWTMTTRPKYSDPPGAMHSLIPQPAHTCLCQPSNRPLMSTTLQFMVTNRIQSKELCGVLTQSCGSQPWLQSSIPWRTLRNPAPHEDQPQQSVWGRTQDFTEFLVSPVCSQDSEIDAELLKPSLEESGNVGWDQRIFLFNKHHRNHFFIQQVWEYCFKGPEIKPLCVMASELLYLEFCVFGHESLFLFKIL